MLEFHYSLGSVRYIELLSNKLQWDRAHVRMGMDLLNFTPRVASSAHVFFRACVMITLPEVELIRKVRQRVHVSNT